MLLASKHINHIRSQILFFRKTYSANRDTLRIFLNRHDLMQLGKEASEDVGNYLAAQIFDQRVFEGIDITLADVESPTVAMVPERSKVYH